MEHTPWIGKEYKDGTGISGQKIAVIGHSHHSSNADFSSFMVDFVKSCIFEPTEDFNGDMATFNAIPSYFGFDDRRQFWPKVMFFNFLPNLVGSSENKFGFGENVQVKAGAERLLRIFRNHRPLKAFIFSKKAWGCCPKTLELVEQNLAERLGPDFNGYRGGHYGSPEFATMAFGLRHPMAANKHRMCRVVRTLMDLPIETWRDDPVFHATEQP